MDRAAGLAPCVQKPEDIFHCCSVVATISRAVDLDAKIRSWVVNLLSYQGMVCAPWPAWPGGGDPNQAKPLTELPDLIGSLACFCRSAQLLAGISV